MKKFAILIWLLFGSSLTFLIGVFLLIMSPSSEPVSGGFMFEVRNAMEDWDKTISKMVTHKERPEWCIYQSFLADGGYYMIECYQKLSSEGENVNYRQTYCENEVEGDFSCEQKKIVSYTASEAGVRRRYYGDEKLSQEDKNKQLVNMLPGMIIVLCSFVTAFIVTPSLGGYWLILWIAGKMKKAN